MCISRNNLPTSKNAGGSKAHKKPTILKKINHLPRLTLIFLCFLSVFDSPELNAQTSEVGVRISVPPLIQVEPATQSPIPIVVIPAEKNFNGALILIKGLPSTIALSKGRLFPSGIWALRVEEVKGLEIQTPPDAIGSSPILVSLVTLEGTTLAQANSNLVIELEATASPAALATSNAPSNTAATAYATAPTTPPEQDSELEIASPPVFTAQDRREIELLMTKGSENLNIGNIAVARLFFVRAAEKGWAEAALAVARTYDEEELKKVTGVVGEVGDLELAKEWYEKARELGSVTADQELQRLGQR